MRSLSATLLATQKKTSRIPYVKVEARNRMAGVIRLDWTRLYTGIEDDYIHAVTMPADGSLIRVRVTPPADGKRLYRQRVANPGPSSSFSQWVDTGQSSVLAVAICSVGATVSLFWIDSARQVQWLRSTDYGANWGSPELIDYSPSTAVYGLAAAGKSGGDIAIFLADQATLYVKKYISGEWQTKVAWDKTTGDLSGLACVYDRDWNLLITSRDSADNYKLWSVIYGDGGDVAANSWSNLKELASAPSGGNFEFRSPCLDKPDVFRGFYVEKFTGTETYQRPFWSHSLPDTSFLSSLWREPVPFNLASEYGLAMAHYGDYVWLSCPFGVWRAPLLVQSLDLTADVIGLKKELAETSGKLTVELRNDTGQYAAPGAGSLSVLKTGCQIDFSPGYKTTAGNENSSGLTFALEAYEHTSAGGKATLLLQGRDGWGALSQWRARYQFRWNKDSSPPGRMNVKQILEFVLARVGLKLEVKSQSDTITDFYPDFTIHPGNSGEAVIQRLLSFVPDDIFIEGNRAYLINPQSSDSSVYSYGTDHSIIEGRYNKGALGLNRIQVEGYDAGAGVPVIVNTYHWEEITRLDDRLKQVDDRNIATVAEAQARGQAYLRGAEIDAVSGDIRVPVNCGQQLYDVIDITDARAGLNAVKRRVLGITLLYSPRRGEYEQRLLLGAV